MFLWTGRMQFWQPRRYFSEKRRKFFPLKSKNDGNKFFFAKKLSNSFCGHVECSFQNSAWKNLSKGRNFLALCPKKMKNTIFRLKILSPIFTLGHASGINFDNSVGIISKTAWNFSLSVRIWKRKKAYWKKKPSKCSIGHVEGDFDNPSYETSTKGENLPARFA